MAAIGCAGRCRRRRLPARRMEAPPPRGFSEEQFRAACRELDQPAPVAPWQLLVESMGVRIYRLYDEVGGRGSSPTPQRVAGPRALPGRARSEEAGPGPGGRSGAAPGAAGLREAPPSPAGPGSVSPCSQQAACPVMLLSAAGESRSAAGSSRFASGRGRGGSCGGLGVKGNPSLRTCARTCRLPAFSPSPKLLPS